jgi:hypothetical protein
MTDDDDDLDARVERAEARWSEVSSGPPPDDYKWGFFSYGDAPPAIGGGAGMFTWFPDRAAMLEFIEETLPYYPPGQSNLDADEIAENTAAVVEKIRLGTLSDEDGRLSLNQALTTCSQLEWIGTVTDLLAGDHPYVVRVRKTFRDDEDEDADGGPIEEDEKEEFFEFLCSWGI